MCQNLDIFWPDLHSGRSKHLKSKDAKIVNGTGARAASLASIWTTSRPNPMKNDDLVTPNVIFLPLSSVASPRGGRGFQVRHRRLALGGHAGPGCGGRTLPSAPAHSRPGNRILPASQLCVDFMQGPHKFCLRHVAAFLSGGLLLCGRMGAKGRPSPTSKAAAASHVLSEPRKTRHWVL